MTSATLRTVCLSVLFAAGGWTLHAFAQEKQQLGFKDTPMLPGNKWHVHDGDRPQPPVVTPGTFSMQEVPGTPPSDAVVLFDGKDLSKWRSGNAPCKWKLEDGAMVINPGSGSIISTEEFGDCQLHIEFATPTEIRGSDQGRGNSGVFFFDRYEIQVLDNYQNLTYPDGQAGAIYGQFPPYVNVCRPPGQWQSYDIVFIAPVFEGEKLVKPARVTVFQNGVVVHHDTEVLGPMTYRGLPKYTAHAPKGPIGLQDHGNPVRYRNIWVRNFKGNEDGS